MPWSEATPMYQKTQFIADYLCELLLITELCELYGISRKTAYKWIERYLQHYPGASIGRSPRERSRCLPCR